ncbi:MAG: hypothetical protein JWR50_548 [Mucilaginibacter sp.]|nr:hypothetical protein [Mucilaginibacter sp.]
MTTAAIREKLYDYIKEADDKKIEAIYSLFEDQMAPSVNWWEDEEVVAELDERVRRWKAGIDRTYTWDEVEQSINELKQKRASKNG